MKRILQIKVFKSGKFFVASGVDIPVVTQGKTWNELTKNIKEVVELYLDGEDLDKLEIASDPSILINYEVPTSIHA